MMDEQGAPLVSVILPNRNHAHYLPKAIDAILGQTWNHLELIVVDDASDDDSRPVAERYQERDKRVQLLKLDTHHGIHRAVQEGTKQAKGEFIYIAAADDFVEPIFLERCVQELQRHPQAGLCFSDPSEYSEETERATTFPLYLSKTPVFFDSDTLVSTLSRNYFHISPNTGIYRLSAFRAAGGYIDQIDWLSDWLLTIVVAMRHGACYLPEQLTYVTIRADSFSAEASGDRTRRRNALNRLLSLLTTPDYQDVFVRLRSAALLPEYRLTTLLWLLQSELGRRIITWRLIVRIFILSAWNQMRGYSPINVRRWLRKLASSENRRL